MRNLIIVLIVIVFSSCDKENTESNVDWNAFKVGVIQKDKSIIEKEISKLLINTNAKPNDNDLIGQKENVDNLIFEISKSKVLNADLFCYACIETYPAQSEITITTDSSGVLISRIIDILTPNDNILKFVDIHDNY
ncbi:MAG: hypothetical protein M0P66_09305 [Salinivirgaceae bacterium]|nr:hypothetical protein [Salinivirgaceae bacterium]